LQFGDYELNEGELPLPETVLMTLHNLCATYEPLAKTPNELTESLRIDLGEIERILSKYEFEGYIKSTVDNEGKKRYYLTGAGIVKVCSSFT
jgi:DNA-binding PadR family transcriptional regulator